MYTGPRVLDQFMFQRRCWWYGYLRQSPWFFQGSTTVNLGSYWNIHIGIHDSCSFGSLVTASIPIQEGARENPKILWHARAAATAQWPWHTRHDRGRHFAWNTATVCPFQQIRHIYYFGYPESHVHIHARFKASIATDSMIYNLGFFGIVSILISFLVIDSTSSDHNSTSKFLSINIAPYPSHCYCKLGQHCQRLRFKLYFTFFYLAVIAQTLLTILVLLSSNRAT